MTDDQLLEFLRPHCVELRHTFSECRTLGCFVNAGMPISARTSQGEHLKFKPTCEAREIAVRLKLWSPPDVMCEHGRAMDMHCCECSRSGFFPPNNCICF